MPERTPDTEVGGGPADGPRASDTHAADTRAATGPRAAGPWGAIFPEEAADPYCLGGDESAELLRGAPWRRFAVVGDSLAEGLGDPLAGYRTVSWADRTAEALHAVVPTLAYLNLGLRGLTARQVRTGQAARAAAFDPDLVAVVCGGNDLLLPGFSPGAVAEELDLLFGGLAGPGTTVVAFALSNVTAAVPELRGGPLEDGLAVLNGVVRETAERYGALVVEMYDHPAVADRNLYSADLIHASARGHAVIAAATIRALGAYLRRQAGPAGARSSAGPGSCPQA